MNGKSSPVLTGVMNNEDFTKLIEAGFLTGAYTRKEADRAISSYRTAHRTAEDSLTDDLTSLYNSRALRENLCNELARQQRSKGNYETSVAGIDLDGFKKANDKLGHKEGDRILRMFARILRKNLRDMDSAYRNGGDEFFMILPETNPAEAERVLERLYERCENTKIKFIKSLDYLLTSRGKTLDDEARSAIENLSFSSGIASAAKEEIERMSKGQLRNYAEQIKKTADQEMYSNKHEKQAVASLPYNLHSPSQI